MIQAITEKMRMPLSLSYPCTPTLPTLVKIQIEDQGGNEIGTKTLTTDGTLTLYLRGYDGSNTFISYISGTWTILGGIGTLSQSYGTSTIFNPTKVGIGTITVTDGSHTDTTEAITVLHGAAALLILSPQTATLTADGTQTYTGTAIDADGNQWDATPDITFTAQKGTFTNNIYAPKETGTWTITGTYLSLSATATVVVTTGEPATITLTLPQTTTTNATFTLTVSLTDAKGNPCNGTIALSNTTNSISPTTILLTNGTWTGQATITRLLNGGIDTITATYQTISKSATITVYITPGGTQTIGSNYGTITLIETGSITEDFYVTIKDAKG